MIHLGEGGRRGLGRKTGGVLQANDVKREFLDIVSNFTIYIQLCSLHSAFNCRTYLNPKLLCVILLSSIYNYMYN